MLSVFRRKNFNPKDKKKFVSLAKKHGCYLVQFTLEVPPKKGARHNSSSASDYRYLITMKAFCSDDKRVCFREVVSANDTQKHSAIAQFAKIAEQKMEHMLRRLGGAKKPMASDIHFPQKDLERLQMKKIESYLTASA